MNDTKKTFHFTLRDNRTGEIIHDTDIHVIIGAALVEEGTAHGIMVGSGNKLDVAATIKSAEMVLEQMYKDEPLLHVAKELIDAKMEILDENEK